MAHSRTSLPALTTTSLPLNRAPGSFSSVSNSPLTPLSELGAICSSVPNVVALKTPSLSSVPSSAKEYITYPDHPFPPRPLTPPAKSRFVNLFESFAKAPIDTPDASRRGSLGDDEASPLLPPLSLPFSKATNGKALSVNLTPGFGAIEAPLKSAPLATGGGSAVPGHWPSRSDPSSILPVATKQSPIDVAESLNAAIHALRHQLNLKNHRLLLAEAEITRLSKNCTHILEEKNKLAESYSHAKIRIQELEARLDGNKDLVPTIPVRTSLPRQSSDLGLGWKAFHFGRPSTSEPKTPIRFEDARKDTSRSPTDIEFGRSATDDLSEEPNLLNEPELVSEEAYCQVLTRVPAMPTEVILSTISDELLATDFDFCEWVDYNGLQLPESVKLLADMAWEDRLLLDEDDLEARGIIDDEDRAYIMRVLKSVAEGENPHLHESFLWESFTEQQYVAIMREQRIDKHVPNLSGIPWPRRLFVDEEDLSLVQVEKAGARGTILTVFGALRRGGARPEPRPRRGTKKSKRVKDALNGTALDDPNHHHRDNSSYARPSHERRTSSAKMSAGHHHAHRQSNSRDKGAFAPSHISSPGSVSSSWYNSHM